MNISEKLDSLECRRDSHARRVNNIAAGVTANITAEELEKGVTLERLESLNVPVLRYATQVTIHGDLPDFNQNARPGGYRAVFKNQNGSVGVRYAGIDAAKKELIQRAVKAAGGAWHANIFSNGLEISRGFYVREEGQRAEQKAATLAALREVPAHLFFGSAFAYSLPYGAGYGVGVEIGAVPAAELMAVVAFFSGFKTVEEVEAAEAAKKAEIDRYFDELRARNDANAQARGAERAAKLAALRPQLVAVKDAPKDGVVFVEVNNALGEQLFEVKMETSRGRLYYTVLSRNFESSFGTRKLAKDGFPWSKALAAGKVYRKTEAPSAVEG